MDNMIDKLKQMKTSQKVGLVVAPVALVLFLYYGVYIKFVPQEEETKTTVIDRKGVGHGELLDVESEHSENLESKQAVYNRESNSKRGQNLDTDFFDEFEEEDDKEEMTGEERVKFMLDSMEKAENGVEVKEEPKTKVVYRDRPRREKAVIKKEKIEPVVEKQVVYSEPVYEEKVGFYGGVDDYSSQNKK